MIGCKSRGNSAIKTAPRPGEYAEGSGDPFQNLATNLSHYAGPFTMAGKWVLNPDSIKERYKDLNFIHFGMMQLLDFQGQPVVTPAGKNKYVRDINYYLGDGKVGIRAFPVAEPALLDPPDANDPYTNKDLFEANKDKFERELFTTTVAQAEIVNNGVAKANNQQITITRLNDFDNYLLNSDPNDPLESFWDIFALTAYTHPEDWKGSVRNLPRLKLQGAFSHMGAYLGRGRTRNAPFAYEKWQLWEGPSGTDTSTYPVNVYEVRFKDGISRKITNRNSRIMMALLNGNGPSEVTVKFPSYSFEFDWLMLTSVSDHLHFFAAWIDPDYPAETMIDGKKIKWADAIRSSEEFKTYCSEHITAVLNTAFNLPFNEAAFVAAYGDYGRKLFSLARERHKRVAGYYPEPVAFTPLYQLNGIQGDPLKITELNRGLVWPLQSTGDFIANLMEQYLAWPDVGAPVSSLSILMQQAQIELRTSMEPSVYFKEFAGEIIALTFVHEAMTKVSQGFPLNDYKKDAFATTRALLSKIPNPKFDPEAVLAGVDTSLDALRAELESRAAPLTRNEAWELYRKKLDPFLIKARSLELKCDVGRKCVNWYSPASIAHRIAIGIHDANEKIQVRAVGTLFDPVDLFSLKDATDSSMHSYELQ